MVDGHRERGRRVSEAFADDLQWDAGLEQQRRVCVAEIVQANHWLAGAVRESLECLRQRMWMQWAAVGAAEHEPAVRDDVAICELQVSPRAEHFNSVWGERSMTRRLVRVFTVDSAVS